jgi:hypothetical protein
MSDQRRYGDMKTVTGTRFYTFWEWAGKLATVALYMTIVALTDGDHLGTALWFFPLLFIIGMGFFASRDKRYEHGKRGINHE